jgi:hypothetical protein
VVWLGVVLALSVGFVVAVSDDDAVGLDDGVLVGVTKPQSKATNR